MAPNPVNVPYGDAVLDINEVMSLLPHRYPFLMVDRIIGFEGETKCRGLKNLTMNELFFQGHFPGHPVMPGVLQLEAMAQVASIVMLRQPGNATKLGYFMSADKIKFRRPVVPGDTLIIEAELTKMRGNIGQALGRCLVNGQVVSPNSTGPGHLNRLDTGPRLYGIPARARHAGVFHVLHPASGRFSPGPSGISTSRPLEKGIRACKQESRKARAGFTTETGTKPRQFDES